MDNIIKNAVDRYVANQPSTRSNQDGGSSSKTENRLSGLLSKIKCKTKLRQDKSKGKARKVQVKWQRYDDEDSSYVHVKVKDGGGSRFVEVCEDTSLHVLRQKAVDLYYDNENKNMYNESCYSTLFNICNSGGLELNENEILSDYLSRKGLLVSKTYFILKSQYVESFTDDELPEMLDTNLKPQEKRRICATCNHTMDNNQLNCLICLQDAEYQASLLLDSSSSYIPDLLVRPVSSSTLPVSALTAPISTSNAPGSAVPIPASTSIVPVSAPTTPVSTSTVPVCQSTQ
jgi:hypothetical protein